MDMTILNNNISAYKIDTHFKNKKVQLRAIEYSFAKKYLIIFETFIGISINNYYMLMLYQLLKQLM